MIPRLAVAGVFPCALLSCSESNRVSRSDRPSGTIVIAASSDPDALFPPLALNSEARQATELIYEYLADVGVGMNTIGDSGFVMQLASGWSWSRDSTQISFQIRDGARWHDGAPVTSSDVAFSFDIYTDTTVSSMLVRSLADIDSVTTPHSAAATFWFSRKGPRQFFTAAAMMLILPRHLFGDVPRDSLRAVTARASPVGSGQFRLGRWNRGSSFELLPVEGHPRGKPSPERLIWSIAPEYKAGILQLMGGALDVFPNVRGESVDALAQQGKFNVVSLPGMDYVFMQLNLRDSSGQKPHPIFGARDVRRALTMALDRESLVKSLFDSLASVSIGPAVRAFPTTDTLLRQIPFDPAASRRILDSLGWKLPADSGRYGFRVRNGRPLRFHVLVPVSSLSRMRIAVLIQSQLRAVGVEMVIDQMDYSAFSARQAARDFDAALASWHLGSSPEAVRVTWTSGAADRGGLNYGGYRNRVFDSLVDSALSSKSISRSREYFRNANQTIIDDAPAIWLYEPRTLIAIHRRISTPPLRPNAWWLSLAEWKTHSGN